MCKVCSPEKYRELEQQATEWQRSVSDAAERLLRVQLREATEREVELETELDNALRELHDLKELTEQDQQLGN